MNVISKKLDKNQIELTIEVPVADLDSYLKKASQKISNQSKIPGFRPGKASYDVIKQRFGEMAIYQEAIDPIIRDTLIKAIEQENLEVVGQPQIDLDKLAPGNDVVYRATVSLMPVIKIKDYKNIKVKPKKVEVAKEKIDKTLAQLQKMRAKESATDKALEDKDKAVIDFSIYLDKVPVDGGQHKDYPIYIGEKFFVEGFEDNIIGMKKGEEKEFELKFPKDYFQKNLAGKMTDIKVKIKEVFKVEKPELNDEFAKLLNFENIKKLEEQIKQNISEEEQMKDDQRVETEIFDKLIKQSEIDDLPQVLIDGESDKMLAELKGNIAQQGMDFESYISSLKTDIEGLRKGFLPQAEKRLKISLILREISSLEKITAPKDEVEKEIESLLKVYKDEQSAKSIRSDAYREYLENMIINKKVIEKLKKWSLEK